MVDAFHARKKAILNSVSLDLSLPEKAREDGNIQTSENTEGKKDRSLKTSVDAPFLPIIQAINEVDSLYTTSCCSGRMSVYVHDGTSSHTAGMSAKHRGYLVVTAHTIEEALPFSAENIWARLSSHKPVYPKSSEKSNPILPGGIDLTRASATLRFEPLILHVKAIDLATAAKFISACREAGLKDVGVSSGLTQCPGSSPVSLSGCTVSLSGSTRLAVPLLEEGTEMVTKDALEKILRLTIPRLFTSNNLRLERLEAAVKNAFPIPSQSS